MVAAESAAVGVGFEVETPASFARPVELEIGGESRRHLEVAVSAGQQVFGTGAFDVDLREFVRSVAQTALAADSQLVPEQIPVVVVIRAAADAPILRGGARIRGQVRETSIDLIVQVVGARARQVSGIIDLEIVAEVHRDELLTPAMVHLVVGPERGASVTRVAFDGVLDVTAEYARANVPARSRAPVVVETC